MLLHMPRPPLPLHAVANYPTVLLYCTTAGPASTTTSASHSSTSWRTWCGVHALPGTFNSLPGRHTSSLSLPPARASSPAGPPLISLEESEGSAMWLQQGHSGKEAGCGDGTSSEQQQLRRRGGRGGCSHPNVSSYPGDVSEGMMP